jgi:hypothetical protein
MFHTFGVLCHGLSLELSASSLSLKEIAEKVGCETGYVYIVRYAMKRAGQLPAD